jgi:hypothetical protein
MFVGSSYAPGQKPITGREVCVVCFNSSIIKMLGRSIELFFRSTQFEYQYFGIPQFLNTARSCLPY